MHHSDTLFKNFKSISLTEMGAIALDNRTETKYIIPETLVDEMLYTLMKEHTILAIDDCYDQPYHTRYFDTTDFRLYLDHHNGKNNRVKIRCRQYLQTNDCFLEIKQKIKETQSIKTRISIPTLPYTLNEYGAHTAFHTNQLVRKIDNTFHRITLCNAAHSHRITIDTYIKWSNGNDTKTLPGLAIIEIKQTDTHQHPLHEWLSKKRIHQTAFSKYSLGAILLHPYLKYNNFKPILLHLHKYSPKTLHPSTHTV